VYRKVPGLAYDNGKENWGILTDKEFMQLLKFGSNKADQEIDGKMK